MAGHLVDGLVEFWRSMAALAGDRRRRMATVRELETLDPVERERILGDAGLTARDFDDIARTPFASDDLLAQGMCALGIEPTAFARSHLAWDRDMHRTCMACQARSRCRRDLATRDFARRYRHYCPNAESLAAIAAGGSRKQPLSQPAGRA